MAELRLNVARDVARRDDVVPDEIDIAADDEPSLYLKAAVCNEETLLCYGRPNTTFCCDMKVMECNFKAIFVGSEGSNEVGSKLFVSRIVAALFGCKPMMKGVEGRSVFEEFIGIHAKCLNKSGVELSFKSLDPALREEVLIRNLYGDEVSNSMISELGSTVRLDARKDRVLVLDNSGAVDCGVKLRLSRDG
jgi:hypothetical protein